MMKWQPALMAFGLLLVFTMPATAQTQSFAAFLDGVRQDARQAGISENTIRAALTDISPIQRVIELDRKQPESRKTFVEYREMIVNNNRINKGRKLLQENYSQLDRAEHQYGVPKQYIVALWGIETNFGSNTGGFNVIPALATLAWEGRRAEFFKKELMNALQIIDEGHISAANMQGSWAGAMGQSQFMPSSFLSYAVDANRDGRRDIWSTQDDIFSSIANYLSSNGWKADERWGRRVQLPSGGLSESLTGRDNKRPLSDWASLGVKSWGGAPLPQADMNGAIVLPDGQGGEAYLVYDNYDTIMDWNRSTYFATSVGLLADRIAY